MPSTLEKLADLAATTNSQQFAIPLSQLEELAAIKGCPKRVRETAERAAAKEERPHRVIIRREDLEIVQDAAISAANAKQSTKGADRGQKLPGQTDAGAG